jgi:methionyl-tRNA formyltransferase
MARIVFFGTPALAVPTLRALVHDGHQVVLVVTQPDRKRGRGGALAPSPVKAAALDMGLTVTSKVNDVLDVEADLGVLVAFGRLIKRNLLDKFPIINLHPSLLPRWRGATPAEATILAGDTVTGMSLMHLVEEMDAGPLYAQSETDVDDRETSMALYDRLFVRGNEMLLDLLRLPALPEPIAQSGEPTYCGKLSPDDFHIDWSGSAAVIARLTRIGRPWTTFRGKRLLVLSAHVVDGDGELYGEPGSIDKTVVHCADGSLQLDTVQPEGKGPMDATAWANGSRPQPDERLI